MATYKVTSDRITGKKRGESVNEGDFVGVDVGALLAGGHLELLRVTKTDKQAPESEK